MSSATILESTDRSAPMAQQQQQVRLNVYVHVANGFDAVKWQKNWREGKILGLNEEFPYGYHHAARYGANVVYSKDQPENRLQKLLRYGCRGVFGFDFVHAWRNRRAILQADVVWTHTESQSLAILLLFNVLKPKNRPKVIGQAVWLIDEWPRLSNFRKAAYRWLLRKADMLTFLSPLNAKAATAIFPDTRIEFVKFGINSNFPTLPFPSPGARKIRVLSVGNDRHRDWQTLIDAVKDESNIELRLLTSTYKQRGDLENVTTVKIDSNEELLAQFEWADMLVLPLKPNLHASGITVIEEATILGVPVICSKVGGLEAYFPSGDVLYVSPFDPAAIRGAIHHLAADPQLQQALIANAKLRMVEGKLTSLDYARRHVELSMEICRPIAAAS